MKYLAEVKIMAKSKFLRICKTLKVLLWEAYRYIRCICDEDYLINNLRKHGEKSESMLRFIILQSIEDFAF